MTPSRARKTLSVELSPYHTWCIVERTYNRAGTLTETRILYVSRGISAQAKEACYAKLDAMEEEL